MPIIFINLIFNMLSQQDKALYLQLKEAYTEANLNKISRNLIRLYQEKQHDKLKVIAGMIADWVQIDIGEDKQGFSKLIMLYHPDRIQYYHDELTNYEISGNPTRLRRLEHILVIQEIEEIALTLSNYEDVDYSPEYVWDTDTSGFSYFSDSSSKGHSERKTKVSKSSYSFYDVVKIRNYGNTTKEIPSWYFEDWDEIEMSESEIFDLEGIEYCTQAVSIDLSGNSITDISPLFNLTAIEELNLADNKIGYIDALSNLLKLKSVNLSNNQIDDLSPLIDLPILEFCDVTGNKIPIDQIQELEANGVTVCHD